MFEILEHLPYFLVCFTDTFDIPTVSPSNSSGMGAAVVAGCVSGVVVLLAIVGVLVGIIRHRYVCSEDTDTVFNDFVRQSKY